MNESEIVDYYREMLNIASNLIPVEWEYLVIGANVDEYRSINLFFYYSKSDNPEQFINGLLIPKMFKCDADEFSEGLSELDDTIDDLGQWFINNKQEPFNELMIRVSSSGSLNSKIGYIDWAGDTDFTSRDQKYFFEYKYFGTVPDESKLKEHIEQMRKYEDKYR